MRPDTLEILRTELNAARHTATCTGDPQVSLKGKWPKVCKITKFNDEAVQSLPRPTST